MGEATVWAAGLHPQSWFWLWVPKRDKLPAGLCTQPPAEHSPARTSPALPASQRIPTAAPLPLMGTACGWTRENLMPFYYATD